MKSLKNEMKILKAWTKNKGKLLLFNKYAIAFKNIASLSHSEVYYMLFWLGILHKLKTTLILQTQKCKVFSEGSESQTIQKIVFNHNAKKNQCDNDPYNSENYS